MIIGNKIHPTDKSFAPVVMFINHYSFEVCEGNSFRVFTVSFLLTYPLRLGDFKLYRFRPRSNSTNS